MMLLKRWDVAVEEDTVDEGVSVVDKESQHDNDVKWLHPASNAVEKIMITPIVTAANSDVPSVQVKNGFKYAPTERCTIPSFPAPVSSFQEENFSIPGSPKKVTAMGFPVSSFTEKASRATNDTNGRVSLNEMVDCHDEDDINNAGTSTESWSFEVYPEEYREVHGIVQEELDNDATHAIDSGVDKDENNEG